MPYIDFKQLEQLDRSRKTPADINWQGLGRSHIGNVRALNEDAYYLSPEHGLWAVADGMGGHARGDYASRVVVEALVHFAKLDNLAASIRDLETRMRRAHDNCRSSFQGEKVGSTVAALLAYDNYTFILWAGDSRVYRLRNGNIEQLTTDHTLAEERLSRGALTPAQASRHSSAHVLTRAVGVHQTLHLELDFSTTEKGDRYLLCSDGLYNAIPLDDIKALLARDSLENALGGLIDLALERDGQDNITGIVVEAG